ncbi:MAG: hypothetical protein HUU10_12085 [Bacteroidetes bacterium]|nr:hypothetical protein [Bacteroidota bacterium]
MNRHSSSLRLILSAYEPEQRFLNVDKIQPNVKSAFTGVGPVEAAIHTTRYITSLHPAEIFFIGTAGSYPNRFLSPGDVVIPFSYRFGDVATAMGNSYMPDPQPSELSFERHCQLPHYPFKVKNGVVLTTPSITRETSASVALRDFYRADAEQLEVFSVARVAAYFHISFTAILGISNLVGPDSHSQWKANEEMAIRHASLVLTDWIREAQPVPDLIKRRTNSD